MLQPHKKDDLLRLNATLYRFNITFTTWSLLLAAEQHSGPISIARLSADVGMSYYAVRNQVLRMPYFQRITGGDIHRVSLTQEGVSKIARVKADLATTP